MKAALSSAPWMSAIFAASAAFSSGAIAHAQSSCESTADCNEGYECRTQSYESCGGGGSCNQAGECTEFEEECETVVYSSCLATTCTADSDCPDHMACQEQTGWQCSGGGMAGTGAGGAGGVGGAAGAAGMEACGPDGCGEPPVCEEIPADSICVARHQLPCETASDCGEGFNCIESFFFTCHGTAGSGGAAGAAGTSAAGAGGVSGMGDPGMPGNDGVCEYVPSGYNYCDVQVLPCASDAECPAGLECVDYYVYGECTGGAGMGGVGGAGGMEAPGGTGGSIPTDGGIDDPGQGDGEYMCPEPTVEQRCLPTYEGGGAAGMGGAGTGGGVSGMGGGSSNPGEGSAGNAGMGGAGGGAGTAPSGGADEDGDSDQHHGRGRGLLKKLLRGCSAGGAGDAGSSESSTGWLVMGAAALLLSRRSRRS